MIKQIKKGTLLLLLIAALLLIGWWGYRFFHTERVEVRTLPAQIEEIEKIVKLSTLEITSEEIFKDTVNIKGVVSRVKSKIYIEFDIENIPTVVQNDTLFVQLPREIINVYEATDDGYQVLDVWNTQMPDEPAPTPLNTEEENIIKNRLKQRIVERMYERGYVKRARENALRSLAAFFGKFKDKVVIIDQYPDGWKQEQQPPIVIPERGVTISN